MKALLVIADNFEDLELFTVTSILRRANMAVTISSLSAMQVAGVSGIKISADKRLNEVASSDYSILLLPSFEGMENSEKLISLVKEFDKENKIIVAMSRAPLVLAKAGILEKKIATVYTGLEYKIPRPRDARIVIDGNIITSRSPTDSAELAFKIIEIAKGKSVAKSLKAVFSGE